MSAPTAATRDAVYRRDERRCAACGVMVLTFQHRRAVGMGGSKNVPSPVDGLSLCAVCNAGCEGDMQAKALRFGWKVRRWVTHPERVPVFYPLEMSWFRLEGITRVRISRALAMEMGCSVYGAEWLLWHEAIA
ncbi:hypothetical protein [Microbacterium sp. K35]|uniref:hypothetical protein n=1 Tax=Microbacterium sp. K35 TaxID=2305440 RepID=UPI00109BB1FB|nr:hypothetical protein [Microbacterium sp. K35]